MKKFLSRLIDSADRGVEAHLVLVAAGAAALIGLSIYHVVVLHHDFAPDPFGRGLGYLFAGGGAAAWGQGLQRRAQGGDATAGDGDA